jgi:predicted Zn-dependent protease
VSAPFLRDILERARAAGARQAELYHKRSRGREVLRDGSLAPGAPRGAAATGFEEQGLALRVRDEAGRYGHAWCSGSCDDADALVAAALFSARAAAADPAAVPLAPAGSVPEAAGMRLADPEALALPEARLQERLTEAEQTVAAKGAGAVDVDRLLLGEVATEVTVVNSEGVAMTCRRTLATLAVALAPLAEGARAVIEERVAVRLADLDARAAATDAIHRALPPRPPAEAAGDARPVVLLEPRAAATLVAALAPLALRSAFDAPPGVTGARSALDLADDPTVPGAPGSAPFDGCGAASRRIVLIEGGRTGGAPADPAGCVVRASYRDRPLPGLRALVVAPGRRTMEEPQGALTLSIAALDIAPGARRLTVRRGNWRRGAEAIAAADGLVWEGKVETLVRAIGATGDDPALFHPGLPVTTPSLRLYGLGPWRPDSPETPSTSIRL